MGEEDPPPPPPPPLLSVDGDIAGLNTGRLAAASGNAAGPVLAETRKDRCNIGYSIPG